MEVSPTLKQMELQDQSCRFFFLSEKDCIHRDVCNSPAVTGNAFACASSLVGSNVPFLTASVTCAHLGKPTPLAERNSTVLRSTAASGTRRILYASRVRVSSFVRICCLPGAGLSTPLPCLLPKPSTNGGWLASLSSLFRMEQWFTPHSSRSRRFSSS